MIQLSIYTRMRIKEEELPREGGQLGFLSLQIA